MSQTSDSGTIALDAPVDGADELISEEAWRLAATTGTGKGRRHRTPPAGASPMAGDVLQATDPAARWFRRRPVRRVDRRRAHPRRFSGSGRGRPFNLTPPAVLAGFAGNRLVHGETPVLTITAGSGSRIYGGPAATLGYRIEGLRPRTIPSPPRSSCLA